MASAETWVMLLLAAAVTYASRFLGVIFSGRLAAAAPLLDWVACVAYALLAGLVSRMLLLPVGPLAQTTMPERLGGIAAGLAVYLLTRRNVLLGVLAGTSALALATAV